MVCTPRIHPSSHLVVRDVQASFFKVVIRIDAALVEGVFALFFIDHLVNRLSRPHHPADGGVMQTKGVGDFFEAVPARGVGLCYGLVAHG